MVIKGKAFNRFKKVVLYFLIIVSYIAVLPLISYGRGNISDPTIRYLGMVLGYWGLLLLFWQFVIGTRYISSLFFDDWNIVLKIHKLTGKYGTLLLLLHPLIIVLNNNYSFLLFLPSVPKTEYELYISFGRLALYCLIVIWVTSAILKGKLKYSMWKVIHLLSYPAIFFALIHIAKLSTNLNKVSVLAPFIAICALFVLGLLLRLRSYAGLGTIEYKCASVSNLNKDVILLELKQIGERKIESVNGQYVYLRLKKFGTAHPFSILMQTDESIYLGIKQFGKFTKKLATLQNNTPVWVDGPYGEFTQNINKSNNSIFFAAGIGITPFVNTLTKPSNTILFFSNQNQDTAVFIKTLRKRLGDRMIEIYSDDLKDLNYKNIYCNTFITKQIITNHIDINKENQYYLCGPPLYMKNVREMLTELGVNKSDIFSEDFSL